MIKIFEIQRFEIGELVEVIVASDQPKYIKNYIGKVGMITSNITTKSSQNIWEVLLTDGNKQNFHALDLKILK